MAQKSPNGYMGTENMLITVNLIDFVIFMLSKPSWPFRNMQESATGNVDDLDRFKFTLITIFDLTIALSQKMTNFT